DEGLEQGLPGCAGVRVHRSGRSYRGGRAVATAAAAPGVADGGTGLARLAGGPRAPGTGSGGRAAASARRVGLIRPFRLFHHKTLTPAAVGRTVLSGELNGGG